jgi:hypothetical protein
MTFIEAIIALLILAYFLGLFNALSWEMPFNYFI